MILANPYRPDLRVKREATTLVNNGYKVTILCWDRQIEFAPREIMDGIHIERIQSIATRYGAGPKQIFHTPRFWNKAIHRGLELKPQIVHCHDLDTLYVGVELKRKLGCKLVYDAHEDYPALMSLYLPGFMIKMLNFLESRLIKQADEIFTASFAYAEKLSTQEKRNIIPIPNAQDLNLFDAVTPEQIAAMRANLNLAENDLAIGYIGGLSRNRQLIPMIQAAPQSPDIRFFLWGEGHQKNAVEAAVQNCRNVFYKGWLPPEQVPVAMQALDIIYYCLREDYPGALFNAPNTLGHAMAAGRPLLANKVGDLGQIINNAKCGILIDPVSSETIHAALQMLRDPKVRQEMGSAGRIQAKAEFNWESISQTLLKVYRSLT